MSQPSGDLQTVTIDRLGDQGDGIAPGPIYAARTLPGEAVSGRRDGDRLRDLRILTPSPDRVRSLCRHYKSCGGCQLQHVSEHFVQNWKLELVRRALAGQGIEAPFRPVLTSPAASRRRARFSARRLKSGAIVGFHALQSDVVIDTPDCTLVLPEIVALRPALQALAQAGASRRGGLSILVTLTSAGPDVVVTDGLPLDRTLRLRLTELAQQHQLARLTWEGETIVTLSRPVVRFGPVPVDLPPGAFLQATAAGEAALQSAVQEIAAGATRAVDLFAGCGTFSLPLAQGMPVHAVEGDRSMSAAVAQAARSTPGLREVTVETRDLFRDPLPAEALSHFDLAVIDPPRAGALAQTARLAGSGVPRLASVSCNPQSFARDAAVLVKAGYHLDWVQVVDQFRWSTHVELVASFTLSHMAQQ